MLNKNNVFFGLALGSILPIVFWVVFEYILQNSAFIMDKPAAPYLIAIVLNLLLLRYYFRNDRVKTANGVMMVTFAFMLLVFIFKMRYT